MFVIGKLGQYHIFQKNFINFIAGTQRVRTKNNTRWKTKASTRHIN